MIDVCNFIPPKNHPSELEYIHFVYETGIRRLRQPFSHFYNRMFLVFKGSGILKTADGRWEFKKGDVFFAFGYQNYEIEFDDELCYFYISFSGFGALPLLESMGIGRKNCRFAVPDEVTDFWVESVRRVNPANANALTESVLMYTLSFICQQSPVHKPARTDKFDMIVDYVNRNFTSPDLSLGKIADIFYYTEKHLSHLFVSRLGVKFTRYLTDLRMNHAVRLMKNGETNVAETAQKCGYSDRFYFSRQFKKHVGKTPTEYIKDL
ncbi:MAG: helix-turn-helix transcriptional regulator [Clostridia bacterium]|nr:helix-turn-helix transcriptional regulator [Clostridia bacterium]